MDQTAEAETEGRERRLAASAVESSLGIPPRR
jgi:hypothetical protein